ncbi:aspartate kinase [Candidatus Bipolaricaulota bacterium]
MIVHKFGGTSLGNADRIDAVTGIIAASQKNSPTVVVVSAISGTTDRLIAAARAAATGDDVTSQEALVWLAQAHHAVVNTLLGESAEGGTLHSTIDKQLSRLERFLESFSVLGELTARGHDAVAGFGELLSASIVAAVLHRRGVKAEPISSTELIVTDDHFGSASPQMPATRKQIGERIRPLVDEGVIPIITGYIGATEDGVPTTLGRSGSDYSAAVIAACLGATELRIWTDVDGILTADPNVVPDARVLRELSYEEATRLARFGAEVLHPRTIGPIIQYGIPLRILNSFNPRDAGTRIVESPASERQLRPAIISATGLQLIRLRSRNGPWMLRSATEALAQLESAGIAVQMFSQSFSEQGMNLVVSEQDAEHSARLLSASNVVPDISHLGSYVLDGTEKVATVSVIGLPCDRRAGIASRAFASLGKHGVRVVAVTQAASEDSVTFCIPDADVAETVRLLHRDLGLSNEDGDERSVVVRHASQRDAVETL